MKLLDGRLVADNLLTNLKEQIKEMPKPPVLRIVRTGYDKASEVYVRMKIKKAKLIGIDAQAIHLPNPSKQELFDTIEKLNNDSNVDAYIVQVPLANNLSEQEMIEKINPNKDVDCFHPFNVGNFYTKYPNYNGFLPCTPAGIIEILKFYNIELKGLDAVIVGRSNIVGKPIAHMLNSLNATTTLCHSKTKDLDEKLRQADLIVSAVGKPYFIKEHQVKAGAIVIDVGINRLENGKLVGDVDFDNVKQKAAYITPVPGGVGPMTVAYLMKNTVLAASKKR